MKLLHYITKEVNSIKNRNEIFTQRRRNSFKVLYQITLSSYERL